MTVLDPGKKQYWRHKASGEVFAIWWRFGHCYEACGPLHHLDVRRDYLEEWDFENDPELAEDVSKFYDDYRLCEDYADDNELTDAEQAERWADEAYHAAHEDGLI